MNAREQMQALIDGKTIMCEGDRYRLSEEGNLVVFYGPAEEGSWGENTCDDFIFRDENYVFDENKAVSFSRAIGMMAQGKIMRCLWSNELFRITDEGLQSGDGETWSALNQGELLEEDEMESMWMEVDE